MDPKYEDPAEIKFINKKFILATNDKKNPIQMVRQIKAGDENNVLVSLSNGETYQEYFDSIQDLISVTSNKAWNVVVHLQFAFRAYGDYDDPKIAEAAFERATNALFSFSYSPTGNYYLPENRMIPQRFKFSEYYYDFTLNPGRDGDLYTSNESAELSLTFISPADQVDKILEELTEDLLGSFMSFTNGISGVNFSGRSISHDCCEISLDEGIEELKSDAKPEKSIFVEVDGKRECYAPSMLNKIVSKVQKK